MSSDAIEMAPPTTASPAPLLRAQASSSSSSSSQAATSGALALDVAPISEPEPAPVRHLPAQTFEVKPASSTRAAPPPTPASKPVETPPSSAPSSQAPSSASKKPEPWRESESLSTWRLLVDRVRKTKPEAAAMLDLAVPITVSRDKLVVGVEDASFEDTRAEQTDARTVLMAEARAHFGASTEVTFERAAPGSSRVASVAYLDQAKKKQMQVEARYAVEHHDLVQHAIRVFQAELRDVKLPAMDD